MRNGERIRNVFSMDVEGNYKFNKNIFSLFVTKNVKKISFFIFVLFLSLNCRAANSTVEIGGRSYTILSADINGDKIVDFYFKAKSAIIFVPSGDDDLIPIAVPRVSYTAISTPTRTYNVYSVVGAGNALSPNWDEGRYSSSPTGSPETATINPNTVYDSGPFVLTLSAAGNAFSPTIMMPAPISEHVDVRTGVFPVRIIEYTLPPPPSLPSTSTPVLYIGTPEDSRN